MSLSIFVAQDKWQDFDDAWNELMGSDGRLGDLLAAESRAAQHQSASRQASRPPHVPGTAKSVIFLFMQGGPSHLETFDSKPFLQKYDGQLLPESLRDFDLAQINTADAQVMAPQFPFQKFGESGQEISSLFPRLSQHADTHLRGCCTSLSKGNTGSCKP